MPYVLGLLLLLLSATASAAPPTIGSKTAGTDRLDGFFPLQWDASQGKLWMEVSLLDREFLYVSSLPAGLGSNDIGLDRGQLGGTRVVRWERHGAKLLLIQSNYRFRAVSDDAAERRAVRDSFAESVLWGFPIEAEEGGRLLVDATPFFLRDVHNVGNVLERAKQGSYRIDPSRCALYLQRTKNFPRNTEVEAIITLTGGPAGGYLRSVTPSPDSVTVREHHSFIALPADGYRPRAFDPRSGFIETSYMDFATPISEPITKRVVIRHRLEHDGPNREIVYYLDRGTPEPIRSALLEGARWWAQAFDAAGFPNAFRVEIMPEDADPMDVRYNIIQWVHRSTRGWSYGASVTDPRTGQILKGHVTLGSLRVRQDFLIAEAFLAPYETGRPLSPAMEKMSLDRLRQLAAHEVGHTLGLAHNYIASTRDRASVMDYPHPWIDLKDGVPDLSSAYAKGIGEWDKVAIRWGYGDSPGGVLEEAEKRNMIFLTDQDARPAGSAHPATHLWDSGPNAVDELHRLLKVRAKALERFGENNIRTGVPLATLEDVLVPLYLSHRYQVEAAAKVIGGLDYRYALRGDGQTPAALIDPAEQRRALDAVLVTLKPETLVLPERVLRLIPPRPEGYDPTRELFPKRTGLAFDPVTTAESSAMLTTDLLFHPERAARLVEHHARDARQPALEEVFDRIFAATWKAHRGSGFAGEVQRVSDSAVLRSAMALSINNEAPAQVRAVAWAKLREWKAWMSSAASADAAQRAHLLHSASEIERFDRDPKAFTFPRPVEAPPGMPIGCDWN